MKSKKASVIRHKAVQRPPFGLFACKEYAGNSVMSVTNNLAQTVFRVQTC